MVYPIKTSTFSSNAGQVSSSAQTLDALCSVRDFYSATLLRVGIDFANIGSLSKLQGLTRDEQKLMKFITLHAELSGVEMVFCWKYEANWMSRRSTTSA